MDEEVQVRIGRSGKRRARDKRDTRKGTRRGTERTNQTHDMDDHGDDMTRSCRHLIQCGVSHIMKRVRCAREKVSCEVYLSTLLVGYSGLLSTVNEFYCNKQFFENELTSWAQPAFGRVPPQIARGRVPSPIFVKEKWVLQFLHLIHDGDGFLRETTAQKSGRSRIGAFWPGFLHGFSTCPWYLLNS